MTDLSWTTTWDSVLSYEDQILPNSYSMTLHFDIMTDNGEEQNIAFDRIKHFVDKVMHDAIFSSIDDERNMYYHDNFKQRMVTFPVPPQDLIVVATLFAKFKAIVEGRIDIHKISLSSIQGDNVTIHFDEEFAEESSMLVSHEMIKAAEKTPWWFRDDSGTADFFNLNPESKELTFITDVTGWEDTDLEWPKTENKKDGSTWSPTIIPGGKTKH